MDISEVKELANLLTRAELRVYLYRVDKAPQCISGIELGEIACKSRIGESIHPDYGYVLVSRIRKKLGENNRIKNEYGSGYYYEEEKKGELGVLTQSK